MNRLIAFFVVHVAVWIGLILVVPGDDRVSYELLGSGATPWVRQFHVALLAVLAIQVAFITARGWWKEVLVERPRSEKTWMWLPPAVIAALGVGVLVAEGLSDAPSSYWMGMTITVGLVGLTEELSFRGIFVVGARKEGLSERNVLLFSSALFGLFHLPNWFLGQDLGPSIAQVVQTAVLGMAFYALRRSSGSLIPCIVLHAAYDWALLQGAFS